jgi:arylsulfatase A-like enzyme
VDDRTLLIVCSDHGFHYDKRQHNYPVDGVLLMAGKNVRNLRIEGSVYDIAPTIIYGLGISGSKDFHGLPLKQAFSGIVPELPAKQYLRAQNYYEVTKENVLEQEKLEELEDLQYINR